GEASGPGSAFPVLTSKAPRGEDPRAIVKRALVGLRRSGTKCSIACVRKAAVRLPGGEAAAGDIVLIAGKGHEKVQVSRQGSIPFDDVEVAREVLRAAGYECTAFAVGKST